MPTAGSESCLTIVGAHGGLHQNQAERSTRPAHTGNLPDLPAAIADAERMSSTVHAASAAPLTAAETTAYRAGWDACRAVRSLFGLAKTSTPRSYSALSVLSWAVRHSTTTRWATAKSRLAA